MTGARIGTAPSERAASDWSEKRLAIVERLAAEGKSARNISDVLGVTRNAVIGIARRRGIVLSGGSSRPAGDLPRPATIAAPFVKPGPSPQSIARTIENRRASREMQAARDAAAPVILIDPPITPVTAAETVSALGELSAKATRALRAAAPMICEAVEDNGPVTLFDLTPTSCRWPLGDPFFENFRFCGARKPFGGPYCPVHTKAATGTPWSGNRRAAFDHSRTIGVQR